MLKHKKKLIFFTSLMTLIPMFAGCILWTRLPDLIATHFGADNRPCSSGAHAPFPPVSCIRRPEGKKYWTETLWHPVLDFPSDLNPDGLYHVCDRPGYPFGRRFYRDSFCRDSLSRTRQLFSESPAELFLWHKNALDIKRQ